MIQAALIGFGTVGRGVNDILSSHPTAGIGFKRIFFRHAQDGGVFTRDFKEILSDREIRLAVECISGSEAAAEYSRKLLLRGVSVVTSNKACVEKYGRELELIAVENGSQYLYEAAVGGGIPCVAAVKHIAASDEIESIEGIINSTSNFILCGMKSLSFAQSLAEAQRLGLAEADPADDIEGTDTARKLAILCRTAWGIDFHTSDIPVLRGIPGLTHRDIAAAEGCGRVIKLLASARRTKTGIESFVKPVALPKESIFASVDGSKNLIRLGLKYAGEVILGGFGAGGIPTASAVVADMIKCAKQMQKNY